MTDIASVLSILFVLLIAFYVCVHTALTISEVKSAEAGANVVPAAFRPRVSLAEHRKAIDYTGEVIQSDLVAALIGAGIDRKSTRLNSSHVALSRMPSSA